MGTKVKVSHKTTYQYDRPGEPWTAIDPAEARSPCSD
jgi:hypothetical protein